MGKYFLFRDGKNWRIITRANKQMENILQPVKNIPRKKTDKSTG
jgi:hypothetical protein